MPLSKARLSEYCGAPASICEIAGCDCSRCESDHKDQAVERLCTGKTIMEDFLDLERGIE